MPETPSHAPLRLGKSALTLSPMAWGMWRFRRNDVAAAQRLVEAALDAGMTLLDTADIYGFGGGGAFGAAEALLGRVLAAAPHLRERFVLASKSGIIPGVPYDSSDAYLTSAVEASLRRLGAGRIDLYQIHRPDVTTHPADLAATLDRLRREGKIGEAGVSNFTAAQTAALQAHLPFPLAATQIEFSPLYISPIADGVLDQAMELGLTVLAWSPLAQGRLGDAAEGSLRVEAVRAALDAVAAAHGVSRTQAAYAWVRGHASAPIPIVGSQRPERIAEAAGALTLTLSKAQWYRVLTAARGEPLP